jgi:hypothetical protein
MANYLEPDYKKVIQKYFGAEPFINMFCSTAFRKEFKKAKLKYKQMEKDVKNNLDMNRKTEIEMRSYGKSGVQRMPLISPNMPGAVPGMGRMPLGPHMGMGGMPMPGPFPMGMGIMPMNPGAMAPMNPMNAMNSMNAMNPIGPSEFMARKKEFLKDKDSLSKDPIVVKRVAITYIIHGLEELGIKDSRKLASTYLT